MCKIQSAIVAMSLYVFHNESTFLPKSKFGPVLHCSQMFQSGIYPKCWWRGYWLDWLDWWGFGLLFAIFCDGESLFTFLLQVKPGQEMCGNMLWFHTGAGAHFRFAPFVQRHKPLAPTPVVPVCCWGICVIAVLLKSLPELAIFCELFLKRYKTSGTHNL